MLSGVHAGATGTAMGGGAPFQNVPSGEGLRDVKAAHPAREQKRDSQRDKGARRWQEACNGLLKVAQGQGCAGLGHLQG